MTPEQYAITSVEIDRDDRTTIVTVRPLDDRQAFNLGVSQIEPQFTEGLEGVGIARCRPEDHYDPQLGAYIATSRAIADLARATEARVVGLVRTEQEHQLDQLGERFSEAINEFVETYNGAMASVGHDGRIVSL